MILVGKYNLLLISYTIITVNMKANALEGKSKIHYCEFAFYPRSAHNLLQK